MLKKMAFHIGSVSFALAVVMLLASLSTIFLGRTLTPEEFGEFALIRTLVLFIAPLAVWGQDVATVRFFSQKDATGYRWDRALKNIVLVGAFLVLAGIAIASHIYTLSWQKSLALFVATLAYVATLFFSNLKRSRQNYSQAILMLNGFRGAFFILVLMMVLFKQSSANFAIYSYLSIIIFLAIVNAIVSFKTIPRGEEPVPREMHTNGLLLMGSQASVTIIGSLDSLFIPGMLDLAALALYQASVVPSQVFNILGRAGKYVWVPEFGRAKKVQVKRLSLIVGVGAFLLLAGMLIFAKPILHLLYDGKYDQGANILRILALAGTIRLFYNLGSSVIVGKLEREALYYHLGVNIFMVLVEIGLLYVMLKQFSVLGAALTMLIVTTMRALFSYGIIWKFRRQLGGASA